MGTAAVSERALTGYVWVRAVAVAAGEAQQRRHALVHPCLQSGRKGG